MYPISVSLVAFWVPTALIARSCALCRGRIMFGRIDTLDRPKHKLLTIELCDVVREYRVGGQRVRALDQISLVSGAVRPIAVPVNQNASSQTMAWSPDSQWFFVLAASGKLYAVNSRTGKVQSLGIPLPRLSQLTVRP